MLYVPEQLLACLSVRADTLGCRRIATLPRDRTREPPIHPAWSACPSRRRRKISLSRCQSPRARGVPLSTTRRGIPSDCRRRWGCRTSHTTPTRAVVVVIVAHPPLIPSLSFHLHATPSRVRRSDVVPSPRVHLCPCLCWPFIHPRPRGTTATPLSCAFPATCGRQH